jgi:hypothetical protein
MELSSAKGTTVLSPAMRMQLREDLSNSLHKTRSQLSNDSSASLRSSESANNLRCLARGRSTPRRGHRRMPKSVSADAAVEPSSWHPSGRKVIRSRPHSMNQDATKMAREAWQAGNATESAHSSVAGSNDIAAKAVCSEGNKKLVISSKALPSNSAFAASKNRRKSGSIGSTTTPIHSEDLSLQVASIREHLQATLQEVLEELAPVNRTYCSGLDDSRLTCTTWMDSSCFSFPAPRPWECSCGEENDASYNFCGMCGSGRNWRCSDCGFEGNKSKNLFCGGCGSARKANKPKGATAA